MAFLSLSLPEADWDLVTAAVDAYGDSDLSAKLSQDLVASAQLQAVHRQAGHRGGSATGAQRWRSLADPSLRVSTAAGVDRMHRKRGLPVGADHRVRIA